MLLQTSPPVVPASVGRTGHLVHLDMLRGLAALAVVVGHIRGFLLVDFGALQSPEMWHKLVYFLGGLGHQSVIAFFALSGFLVGGKVLKDMLAGSWSWGHYIVARLARLWTVVIPALVVTLVLDVAGRALSGGQGYDGGLYDILSSGPSSASPVDHSFATFLANAAFLQTITAPVYGSNGPLWSLANEFWYYVMAPLAAFAVLVPANIWLRVMSGVAAVGLAWLLPAELVILGVIWLSGAAAHHLSARIGLAALFAHPAFAVVAILALGATVVAGFRWNGMVYDLVLGLAWAAALPALAHLPDLDGLYARIASGISEISYTLYATHFPLLAFIYFTVIAPQQWQPGLHVFGLGLAMLAAAVVMATALWWCFERNTPDVRAAASAMLLARRGK